MCRAIRSAKIPCSQRMRRIIRELVDLLPEERKSSSRVKELTGWSCTTTMHLVEINAQPFEGETNARVMIFRGLRSKPVGKLATPTQVAC